MSAYYEYTYYILYTYKHIIGIRHYYGYDYCMFYKDVVLATNRRGRLAAIFFIVTYIIILCYTYFRRILDQKN